MHNNDPDYNFRTSEEYKKFISHSSDIIISPLILDSGDGIMAMAYLYTLRILSPLEVRYRCKIDHFIQDNELPDIPGMRNNISVVIYDLCCTIIYNARISDIVNGVIRFPNDNACPGFSPDTSKSLSEIEREINALSKDFLITSSDVQQSISSVDDIIFHMRKSAYYTTFINIEAIHIIHRVRMNLGLKEGLKRLQYLYEKDFTHSKIANTPFAFSPYLGEYHACDGARSAIFPLGVKSVKGLEIVMYDIYAAIAYYTKYFIMNYTMTDSVFLHYPNKLYTVSSSPVELMTFSPEQEHSSEGRDVAADLIRCSQAYIDFTNLYARYLIATVTYESDMTRKEEILNLLSKACFVQNNLTALVPFSMARDISGMEILFGDIAQCIVYHSNFVNYAEYRLQCTTAVYSPEIEPAVLSKGGCAVKTAPATSVSAYNATICNSALNSLRQSEKYIKYINMKAKCTIIDFLKSAEVYNFTCEEHLFMQTDLYDAIRYHNKRCSVIEHPMRFVDEDYEAVYKVADDEFTKSSSLPCTSVYHTGMLNPNIPLTKIVHNSYVLFAEKSFLEEANSLDFQG